MLKDDSASLAIQGHFPSKDKNSFVSGTEATFEIIDGGDYVKLPGNVTKVTIKNPKNNKSTQILTYASAVTNDTYVTVRCTFSATCTNGRTYTYSRDLIVHLPVADYGLSLCSDEDDLDGLEFTDQSGKTFDGTPTSDWLGQKEGESNDQHWLLVRDPAFNANVMYLKTTSGAWGVDSEEDSGGDSEEDTKVLPEVSARTESFFASASYAISEDGNTVYFRIAANENAEMGDTEDITLYLSVAGVTKSENVRIYREPVITIRTDDERLTVNADEADVTNLSKQITYNNALEQKVYGGFTAEVTPSLDNVATDEIVWYLEVPEGYTSREVNKVEIDPGSQSDMLYVYVKGDDGKPTRTPYLALNKGQRMLTIQEGMVPEFRVILCAQLKGAYMAYTGDKTIDGRTAESYKDVGKSTFSFMFVPSVVSSNVK